METNERKNILVITAGIFLIVFVALLTFLKPIFKNIMNSDKSSSDLDYVQDVNKAEKITSEDLKKRMLKKENVAVLDIRSQEEYVQEHILDSLNIPYQDMAAALAGLDKEKTYVLVDDGATLLAASLAGGIFQENGFTNIFYLSGGFPAWKNNVNLNVSAGDPNSFSDQAKVTYINSDELKNIFDKGGRPFIIDLRNSDQFQSGHIPAAVNISLANIEKERMGIPLGRKIILYDENSLGAFQGAVRLYDMGFFNAAVLEDGFRTWKEKGYEIIK